MSAIPAELITLGSSTLIGTASKLIGLFVDAKNQQRQLEIAALQSRTKSVALARRVTNRHFQWTRRVIALLCVFFVIAFPKIIAAFAPSIPVVVGYSEISGGFLGLFSSHSKVIWQTAHGLVLTPLDTHLLAAIIGLYFGGSLAQH